MKKILRICALAAFVLSAIACNKEELRIEEQIPLSEYSVRVVNTAETRMTTSGAWEDNDVIFMALDGDDNKSYKLLYSTKDEQFTLTPVGSVRTISSSNTVSAIYTKEGILNFNDGVMSGTVNGDFVYTKSGSCVVDDATRTITITMCLNVRPISLIKITDATSQCYVSNALRTYKRLTSLSAMTWEEGTEPSYIYNVSEKVSYCYGVFPKTGVLEVQLTGSERRTFTRSIDALKDLGSSEMYTVKGPQSSEASAWTELLPDHFATGEVVTYSKGTVAKPITLVVTGDGFTAYDHLKTGSKFLDCATKCMDQLFKLEPYKTYKHLFNVYFIPAVSAERGNSTSALSKDTYFKTKWEDGDYSDMETPLVTPSRISSLLSNFCPDVVSGLTTVSKVRVLCLCNSDMYGALCYRSNYMVNYCFVSSCLSGNGMAWANWGTAVDGIGNVLGQSRCTPGYVALAFHEFGGHCIGRLDDEYSSAIYASEVNTSASATYLDAFKQKLAAAGGYNFSTPEKIAAGDYTGIGPFLGRGVYRAEYVDCMCDNRPYYNVWSRYLIAKEIHDRAGLGYTLDDFIAEVPHQVIDLSYSSTKTRSAVELDAAGAADAFGASGASGAAFPVMPMGATPRDRD